jgi:hypothetical protein
MMFGGVQAGFDGGMPAASSVGPNSPQRRMFKRGANQILAAQMAQMQQQGMMQVNGMQAAAGPSQARFFSYSEFVQAKSPGANGDDASSGGGGGGGGEKSKKAKKSKRSDRD